MRGIGLEEQALKRIYSWNFRRYAGKKPTRVSIDQVIEECEKFSSLGLDGEGLKKIEAAVR